MPGEQKRCNEQAERDGVRERAVGIRQLEQPESEEIQVGRDSKGSRPQ